ncbi:MAG: hypothetical protein ACKOSQ_06680 [Planctomycetaceae bacterium]
MRFHRFGLDFSYPDSWTVDTDDAREGRTAVTVQSPDGGFWSVSGHATGGRPAHLAEAVVTEMRDEYRDLDAEPAADVVEGRTLSGFDLNFYCLDLTNTAQVRTLETPTAIWLLLCQAEDREWDRVAPVFAAMTTSFVRGLGAEPVTESPD